MRILRVYFRFCFQNKSCYFQYLQNMDDTLLSSCKMSLRPVYHCLKPRYQNLKYNLLHQILVILNLVLLKSYPSVTLIWFLLLLKMNLIE